MRPSRIRILEKKIFTDLHIFLKDKTEPLLPSVMHTNFILLTLNDKAYMITKPLLIEPSL